MTEQELNYLIKVNDRDLRELKSRVKDTNKALGAETEKASRRGSSALKGLGRVAAVGTVAGLVAVGVAAKIGFDEFNDGQKVAAQTAAVLKSTGGAARVTAGHVSGLAGKLLNLSGVDDEAIQSGENLLLTFTSIQNRAGKGNAIFDRATKTMLDMSVALGTDTKTSAIQLGKALQDPVRGITALRRVGVNFTDAQQKQIKTLVDSGKTMQAQKLILGELHKEFGGSAKAAGETFDGQLHKLEETGKNLAGSLVGALIPSLTKLLGFVNQSIPTISRWANELGQKAGPAISQIGGAAVHYGPIILATFRRVAAFLVKTFGPVVTALRNTFRQAFANIGAVLRKHREDLRNIGAAAKAIFQLVAAILRGVVVPALRFAFVEVLPRVLSIALSILGRVAPVVKRIADFTRRYIVPAFKFAFNLAASFIRPVLGLLDSIASKAKTVADALGKVGDVAGAIGDHIPGNPFNAAGGPVRRGQAVITGDRGPEAFVAPSDGFILPAGPTRALRGAGGGGGPLVNVERLIVRRDSDIEVIAAGLSRKLALR